MSAFSKRCFGSNNTTTATTTTTLKKQQQQHVQLFQWQMAWSERAVAMFAKNDFSAKRESFQHAQTQTHTRTHTHTHWAHTEHTLSQQRVVVWETNACKYFCSCDSFRWQTTQQSKQREEKDEKKRGATATAQQEFRAFAHRTRASSLRHNESIF